MFDNLKTKFNNYSEQLQQKISKKANKNIFSKFIFTTVDEVLLYSIKDTSAEIAFYFALSFFPFLLLLITLLPLLPFNYIEVYKYAIDYIPSYLQPLINNLNSSLTSYNISLLSLSFIIAIYSSSTVTSLIIKNLNLIFDTRFMRSTLLQRVWSVIINFIFISLIFLFAIFATVFDTFINFLDKLIDSKLISLTRAIEIALLPLFCFIIVIILYHFSTPHRMKFKDIYIGSLITTLILILSFFGFNLYLTTFHSYIGYGVIGALIILLLYFYILAFSILFGAIINKTILRFKHNDNIYNIH